MINKRSIFKLGMALNYYRIPDLLNHQLHDPHKELLKFINLS